MGSDKSRHDRIEALAMFLRVSEEEVRQGAAYTGYVVNGIYYLVREEPLTEEGFRFIGSGGPHNIYKES